MSTLRHGCSWCFILVVLANTVAVCGIAFGENQGASVEDLIESVVNKKGKEYIAARNILLVNDPRSTKIFEEGILSPNWNTRISLRILDMWLRNKEAYRVIDDYRGSLTCGLSYRFDFQYYERKYKIDSTPLLIEMLLKDSARIKVNDRDNPEHVEEQINDKKLYARNWIIRKLPFLEEEWSRELRLTCPNKNIRSLVFEAFDTYDGRISCIRRILKEETNENSRKSLTVEYKRIKPMIDALLEEVDPFSLDKALADENDKLTRARIYLVLFRLRIPSIPNRLIAELPRQKTQNEKLAVLGILVRICSKEHLPILHEYIDKEKDDMTRFWGRSILELLEESK